MRVPVAVLEALRTTQAQLERLRPQHVAAILAIATEIQQRLEARLKSISRGRWATLEAKLVLTQVRAVTEILGAEQGQRMGTELERLGRLAAQVGRDGLIDQVTALGSRYQGAVRRLVDTTQASELLDPGLLEYYRVSRQTYGAEVITKMRGTLARAAMSGKTVSQTWEELSADVGITPARAERIVRTEQSFARHRRQQLDLIDTYGNDAEELWRKQLVATIDSRTGEDSVFVNGQTRKLMDEFQDNEGRKYQHPPNRPNDREVVIYVLVEPPASDG